jgi:SAM-dependent methyltransferase
MGSFDMSDVRQRWEERAITNRSRLSGVLFKGLSQQANSVLGDWHAWLVREMFLPGLPAGARVLDLGCGYGRLAEIITTERPDVEIIGQDLAMSYCRTFTGKWGPCVLADAAKPPFVTDSFDGIISITCLMYVPRIDLARTFETLNGILRPGGIFLSVEPGYELQRLIARLRAGKVNSPTGGLGFAREEYQRSFERSSFNVTRRGGNPYVSSVLLVPGIALSGARWVGTSLANLGLRDHRPGGYSRFALHRWILATKAAH